MMRTSWDFGVVCLRRHSGSVIGQLGCIIDREDTPPWKAATVDKRAHCDMLGIERCEMIDVQRAVV